MLSCKVVNSALLVLVIAAYCRADSIEVQNNPVPDGTIHVADGDADRSDWEGIPWFETDDDFDEFDPVDIDRVQVAHDNQNVYFHVQSLRWEVEESWRIGLYLDTDEDDLTGYTGSFLSVGADVLVEASGAFDFVAATQGDWGWESSAELPRDQSDWTDFEVAVPRTTLGDASILNFLLFANNFCCDFQTPDDIYPNGAGAVGGDYFTYELGAVRIVGDFDESGRLDRADIDELTRQSASQNNVAQYDLNNDAQVDGADVQVWIKDLYKSWVGDANLDGEFNSGDLVTVLASGTYEADVDAVWSTGDFSGDGRTTTSDLVLALADGGYEQGPRAAAAAVPEPTTLALGTCT